LLVDLFTPTVIVFFGQALSRALSIALTSFSTSRSSLGPSHVGLESILLVARARRALNRTQLALW
jgi:hypothetical protein